MSKSLRVLAVCAVLAALAACTAPPPAPLVTAPPAKPLDAKTQLENQHVRKPNSAGRSRP